MSAEKAGVVDKPPTTKKAAEGKNWKTDLPADDPRVHEEPRQPSVRQRQGARDRLELPRRHPAASRAAVLAALDMVAKYPTHADKMAFWRLPTCTRPCSRRTSRMASPRTSAGAHQQPPGRVRRRRRARTHGLPSCSRRTSSRSIRRTPTIAASRAAVRVGAVAHQGADQGQGDGHRARRPRHHVHPVPLRGWWQGKDMLAFYPEGSAPIARRGGEHGNDLRLRQRDHDAGNQDDALPGRQDLIQHRAARAIRSHHGPNEISLRRRAASSATAA